ncbi:MAG: hypothetical protein AVO35_02020 [Candidatus Aegiribacteria sp. MLS_C]|nr:MAG: hypothetical protein AVO35_02020 [Candidatus Aegiribacteria sp. MLS_C]
MIFSIDPALLIDISAPLSEKTSAWPGDTPFSRTVREEEGFRTSRIVMSSHSGSHMDAPAHLLEHTTTVDMVPVQRLLLPAVLVEATENGAVDPGRLAGLDLEGRALLIRSVVSSGTPGRRNGHLSAETAQMAVNRGAYLAGTDAMSIDGNGSVEAHRILLGASVIILENLRLEEIRFGEYVLLCFPLRIENSDGSPVRAFLHPY